MFPGVLGIPEARARNSRNRVDIGNSPKWSDESRASSGQTEQPAALLLRSPARAMAANFSASQRLRRSLGFGREESPGSIGQDAG